MKKTIQLSLLCVGTFSVEAQTRVDLATQAKRVDFTSADTTKPSKAGTALPAACSIGETFFKTDAAAGKNLYACTAANVWSVIGAAASTDAVKLQGRAVSMTSPVDGSVLLWNNTTGQWEPAASSSAYAAGTGIAISDSTVAVDGAVIPQYTLGTGSPSAACDAGREFYTDSATGSLYYCSGTNTWRMLSLSVHTHNTADLTAGAVTLARGGTNQSAWSNGKCVQVSSDGTKLESASGICADPATLPAYQTGTGVPSAACTVGRNLYTDTASGKLYYCSATNTWQLLITGAHTHAASDIASGSVALARGGTNQATWTNGKCVQVSSDGTKLESASGVCADPATLPTYQTGTGTPGAACTVGRDLYTDTASGKLYYCSATNTWQLLITGTHTHAASDIASGSVALARGGTNQATWTNGKCVQVSSDGTKLESASGVCADPATLPSYRTGTGAPVLTCTLGRDFYTDTATSKLYYCSAANTWQALVTGTHTHAASDIASGSVALVRGGTNQTTWTGSKCVQVSSDGTKLESAAGPCADPSTLSTYQTGTGAPSGSCTAGRDFYTDTTASKLYYCSAANTWQGLAIGTHTHAASDIASGTVALARGGTNQTTWSSGKCVQVSADGSKLESASGTCSGASTSVKQMFIGPIGGGVGASTTAYTSIGGGTFSSSSEASKRVAITSAGTFTNGKAYISSAQPGSDMTCKLRVNAVDSSFQIVITASSPTGSILSSTGSVSVNAGDYVSWGCTNASGSTSASVASLSAEFSFN